MIRETNEEKQAGDRPRQRRSGGRQNDQKAYLNRLYLLMLVIAALLTAVLLLLPEPEKETADGAGEEAHREVEESARETAPETGPRETEATERPMVPPPASPEREQAVRGRLAIVIDDVGNDLSALERFLKIPVDMTFAVLPRRPYSIEAARRIRDSGKEVILHLPMEPLGDQNPGVGAILVGAGEAEIRSVLDENLRSVPGVVGVNNHMGSRATADPEVMDAVLSVLAERGLFFLDSRTNPQTLGAAVAERHGVPYLERAVFLDNDTNADSIRAAFEDGLATADRKGHAVLIGHVTVSALADVLEELYPEIIEDGYELYNLSDLVLRMSPDYARAGD